MFLFWGAGRFVCFFIFSEGFREVGCVLYSYRVIGGRFGVRVVFGVKEVSWGSEVWSWFLEFGFYGSRG